MKQGKQASSLLSLQKVCEGKSDIEFENKKGSFDLMLEAGSVKETCYFLEGLDGVVNITVDSSAWRHSILA